MQIDIAQTHIRLTSDLKNHHLAEYIKSIRTDLKMHIAHNQDFLYSLEPVEASGDGMASIVERMCESSALCDVGPMACVAGTISEMSLEYLIERGSRHSIVENGGDIALVNDRKVLCGIYSGNEVLGNGLAFEIMERKSPLGICTSSGRIGHSISFGSSDSVSVVSRSPSVADGLATRIANEVNGVDGEEKVASAADAADGYRDLFEGVLIVSDDYVATVGKLPKIVETSKFHVNKI